MGRQGKKHLKEMISVVELSHTDVVGRPGLLAQRLRRFWLTCQCAVLGHDAPPRRPGQWLLCNRCGKLVGK